MRPHSQEARAKMTIKVGDKLPDATFQTMTADGVKPKTSAELFAGKKVVLFGVPGAFTPTCSRSHLPGFIAKADEFSPRA
jgi:peroxiredoxin